MDTPQSKQEKSVLKEDMRSHLNMSACHMYSCEKEVHCLYSEYYHESVKINSEKKHIREGNYRGTVSTAKVMNSRRQHFH